MWIFTILGIAGVISFLGWYLLHIGLEIIDVFKRIATIIGIIVLVILILGG